MRTLVVLAVLAGVADADPELCAPGARHHGAAIDLDVKHADVHDVLRLLADVGHVNLVIANDVTGEVTVRLQKVPWDAATCSIAASLHLHVTLEDRVLSVSAAGSRSARPAGR